MRFLIEISVDYDDAMTDLTEDEVLSMLEKEVDRHIQDGLLLDDLVIDQYSADVSTG